MCVLNNYYKEISSISLFYFIKRDILLNVNTNIQ